MATELQVISHDDPVLELIKFASVLVCSSTTFIIEPRKCPCYPPHPLPHRDSQGRQTAALLRRAAERIKKAAVLAYVRQFKNWKI
jgi:hypothetical protein